MQERQIFSLRTDIFHHHLIEIPGISSVVNTDSVYDRFWLQAEVRSTPPVRLFLPRKPTLALRLRVRLHPRLALGGLTADQPTVRKVLWWRSD